MFPICCPHHHCTLPADPTGKYLSLLEAAFVKLDAGTLRELSVSAGGLVKTLAMVWTSSKSYNTAKRMVRHTHILLFRRGVQAWSQFFLFRRSHSTCFTRAQVIPRTR